MRGKCFKHVYTYGNAPVHRTVTFIVLIPTLPENSGLPEAGHISGDHSCPPPHPFQLSQFHTPLMCGLCVCKRGGGCYSFPPSLFLLPSPPSPHPFATRKSSAVYSEPRKAEGRGLLARIHSSQVLPLAGSLPEKQRSSR